MWKLKKTSPFLSIMVIIFITSPTPANMQSSRGRRISSVTEEFDKLWIKSSLNVVVAAATAAQAQQRGWYPSTWQNTDSFIWAFTEQRAAHKPAISSHLTRVPTDQKAKNKNANCRWKQGSLSIGSFRLTSELPTNTSVFTCGCGLFPSEWAQQHTRCLITPNDGLLGLGQRPSWSILPRMSVLLTSITPDC